MDKSDTPRTEQMIDSCGDYEKAYHYKGRFANFARGLEREVTALTAQLAEALQDAEVGRKWRENSSLEEWFPFTAQELAEARRDAERLDWMDKNVTAIRDIGWLYGPIRAAIDAAMKEPR